MARRTVAPKPIGLHVFIDEDLDAKLDSLRAKLVPGAHLSRSDTVRHAIHRCWSQFDPPKTGKDEK